MKNYYLGRIRLLERQIELAKVGFMQSVDHLADSLKVATEGEVGAIVKELVAEEHAYNELKGDLEFAREKYREEVEKEGGVA
jgi:hypothetical protein